MRRLLLTAMTMLVMVFAVPRADAATFTLAIYPIGLHQAEPGLVLFSVDQLAKPHTFTLGNVGDSTTVTLFLLGTQEPDLNLDDFKLYPIGVAFIFSGPPPLFGGVAFGATGAFRIGATQQAVDFGYVRWGQPAQVAFGNGGLLLIALEDDEFSLPGLAAIDATFTLVRVTEPASLVLVGLGLIGLRGRGWLRKGHPTA